MFCYLTKIISILTAAFLLIALTGCQSTQSLKHPIVKGSRIAVITNLRNSALFQRAGTTTADNASFLHRVPGLNINTIATRAATNSLARNRQFQVIPIYHAPADELLTLKVIKRRTLTPAFKDFVSQLTRNKKVKLALLITPGDIDFSQGQYFGNIWWVSGYGLFNRAFMFMQTNTVFSAYNIYFIDLENYQVLAKSSDNLEARVHGINIAWHKGYAGITPKSLAIIKRVIREQMPRKLAQSIHKIGLS